MELATAPPDANLYPEWTLNLARQVQGGSLEDAEAVFIPMWRVKKDQTLTTDSKQPFIVKQLNFETIITPVQLTEEDGIKGGIQGLYVMPISSTTLFDTKAKTAYRDTSAIIVADKYFKLGDNAERVPSSSMLPREIALKWIKNSTEPDRSVVLGVMDEKMVWNPRILASSTQ
jgi:hypothetical protein